MEHLGYPLTSSTLGNGLRVLISPDHSAPVVAVNLWYEVGSRDEAPGSTGLAHLFEHVMFQGSANVGSGEHLAAVQAAGGTCNATTWFDRTNYFETVPTGALDLALWLEADRMRSLLDAVTKENLDNQRDVVEEEKRQRYDNVPYGDLMERLLPLVFPDGHPYAHPTIGSMADLDAATLDDAHAFFRTWYSPANAVVTLVGDVTPDDGVALVERHFGAIPSGAPLTRRRPAPLEPLTGVPRVTVTNPVPASTLYAAWRLPERDTREADSCDIALEVLGGSQTSRLYRRLVRDHSLASTAGTGGLFLAWGSMGFAFGRALDDVTLDDLEAALVDELDTLAADGPTAEELDRVRVQFERHWLTQCASVDDRADLFSSHEIHGGDPDRVNRRVAEYCSVSAAEVTDAVRTYLRADQRAVLHYERGPFQEA